MKIEHCRFLDDYYAQFESRTEKAKAAQEIQVVDIIDFKTRTTQTVFSVTKNYHEKERKSVRSFFFLQIMPFPPMVIIQHRNQLEDGWF